MRVLTLIAIVLLGVSEPTRAADPAPYFDEAFDIQQQNPALEGYSNFRIEKGVIHRKTDQSPSDQDRQYLRTVRGNYLSLDFVYEITYTIVPQTIVYVGIGQADPTAAYNEPSNAVNLRLHSPDVGDGTVKLNILGETNLGFIHSNGPHRVRIEKQGPKVTFSIDVDYDGVFKADITQVIPDITTAAPFLTGDSSRLFFGSARVAVTFDDFSVYPPLGKEPFRRGDVNGDGQVNLSDPIGILHSLFSGGSLPCADAADVSDDGVIDLTDAIGLIGYLFLGTLKPPAPFAACGQDPTDDRLSCESPGSCR